MDPSIYATWAPSQVSEEQRAGSSNEEWARDRTSQHQMGQQTHHQQQPQQQHQHAQQPQQGPLASPTLMNPSIMSDFTTLDDLGGAFDTVCGLVAPWPCGRVVTLPRAWLALCGLRYLFCFIPGPNTSSLNPYYAPYANHTYFPSFNTLAYGQPWPPSPIPISNYSTLNGATTNTSTSQTQQQQSQSVHQQSQQPAKQHQQPQQLQIQPVHSPTLSPPSNHMMIE